MNLIEVSPESLRNKILKWCGKEILINEKCSDKEYYVYVYYCPISNKPFYVGMGKKLRYEYHYKAARCEESKLQVVMDHLFR